jgi:hypothetical protein
MDFDLISFFFVCEISRFLHPNFQRGSLAWMPVRVVVFCAFSWT